MRGVNCCCRIERRSTKSDGRQQRQGEKLKLKLTIRVVILSATSSAPSPEFSWLWFIERRRVGDPLEATDEAMLLVEMSWWKRDDQRNGNCLKQNVLDRSKTSDEWLTRR